MLVRTTKLMDNIFVIFKQIIDKYNSQQLQLSSRNLLIIFFDKVVKLLHLALMHPKDYTVEVLCKFLNAEKSGSPISI